MKWKPGAHASTFGGNPVAVAAALATIELLERELIENAARIGASHAGPHARLAAALPERRRRARARPDDRHRNGAGSANQGARPRTARPPRCSWPSSAACWCSAPGANTIRLSPAASHHARSGRLRCRYTGGMPEAWRRSRCGARKRTLDVGCGINKYPGLDRHRPESAQPRRRAVRPRPLSLPVSGQLVRPRCGPSTSSSMSPTSSAPWRSSTAWSAPGGRVFIVTPHYTDFSSFCDPTHRWHLNSFSFRYFGADNAGFGYYSAGPLPRSVGPRKAAGPVALAWLRISGQSFAAVPPVLGALSVLHGARQSDGVRVRSDKVGELFALRAPVSPR